MADAGWYDDGAHPGHERYWDGTRWTEHFYPPLPENRRSRDDAAPAAGGVELNAHDWQISDAVANAIHHAQQAAAAGDLHGEFVAVDAARSAAVSASDAARTETVASLDRDLGHLRSTGRLHQDFRSRPPRSADFRRGLEALVSQLLERASDASRRRDIPAETMLTQVALQRAAELGGRAYASKVEKRVRSMEGQGQLLVGSLPVGMVLPSATTAHPIEVRSDRVRHGWQMHPITATTWAQVYLDGQKQIAQDPWGSDAYLAHPLPPELRAAAFQVGDEDWAIAIPIAPGHADSARALAKRVHGIAADALRRSMD